MANEKDLIHVIEKKTGRKATFHPATWDRLTKKGPDKNGTYKGWILDGPGDGTFTPPQSANIPPQLKVHSAKGEGAAGAAKRLAEKVEAEKAKAAENSRLAELETYLNEKFPDSVNSTEDVIKKAIAIMDSHQEGVEIHGEPSEIEADHLQSQIDDILGLFEARGIKPGDDEGVVDMVSNLLSNTKDNHLKRIFPAHTPEKKSDDKSDDDKE